jgi:biopolymer transport protein ExbD
MAIGGPGGDGDELEGGSGGIFADINITPLTDIFLVLLIIFMVTTTAIAEAGHEEGGFEVNLPKGAEGETQPVARDVTVAVLADGRAVVAGEVVDETRLRAILTEARAGSAQTTVLFQADEGVAHGRVVSLMELARSAGLTRLAIATRAEPSP